ncbi:hypothetical protein R3W88_000579 [Solanum pinnatisectum]|uniref:Endonuclease/exonuclease/phosphatase domain-containing protein n=1 Tax=Solanum pinnatisectum TaxID=50273 RepID=A0AAV9MFS2_9SOLN|nr:hypothetical protein R3W88_000579 [Solanum pinnatisectum]
MTWLVWNVRGINKKYKQKELNTCIRENHIKLVGLVETKVKMNKVDAISQRIVSGWSLIHNYASALNGRIWIMWDERVFEVNLLAQGAQYVHCKVLSKDKKIDCCMTVVYGYNTTEQRKALWNDIRSLVSSQPWLVWGDFNALLHNQDRLYGAPVTRAEIKDFADCVQDLFLNELLWKGEFYSWSNKQLGSDRIYSRLDRAIGNDEWMMQYGQLVVEYKPPHISYHSPMLLDMKLKPSNTQTPFRFFNLNLSIKYTDNLALEEKDLLIQLEKWTNIEESINQQKSRAMWIRLGDSNNKYFTAMIKERRHRKQIIELTTVAGAKIMEPDEIRKEIITFYQSLMGTAMTNITAVSAP